MYRNNDMNKSLYFSHDYFARNDPKLVDVMMQHGVAGIGIYWCIVEMLYEQGGALPLASFKSIAFALHSECDRIASVVRDFGLFEIDGEMFTSPSVAKRINRRHEVCQKNRENAKKRWEQCDRNAIINNKDKVKENNISPNGDKGKRTTFAPPTVEEVRAYLVEKGIMNVDAERFVDFYESKGWVVGKNKMKSWQAAIRTWAKDERPAVNPGGRKPSSETTKIANDPWK